MEVFFSPPVKDVDIIDNYDYSQTVKYTPVQQVSHVHIQEVPHKNMSKS